VLRCQTQADLQTSEGKVNSQPAIDALKEIRAMAIQHPCFWSEAFDAHDIQALADEGGDVCDWTMVAILADDALKLCDI
jgi:hypothetical protein